MGEIVAGGWMGRRWGAEGQEIRGRRRRSSSGGLWLGSGSASCCRLEEIGSSTWMEIDGMDRGTTRCLQWLRRRLGLLEFIEDPRWLGFELLEINGGAAEARAGFESAAAWERAWVHGGERGAVLMPAENK